jgi:hypothetical protein
MKLTSQSLTDLSRSAEPQPSVGLTIAIRITILVVVTVCIFTTIEAEATSVVALIDRNNHTVVIAADCRVNRTRGSSSECKIVERPGCLAAIAGLYSENVTGFDVRRFVDAACEHSGDLRAKAEEFLRVAKHPYEQTVHHIRDANPSDFARSTRNKATEVVFAGIQNGEVALIVRGLLADSSGKVSVERFESVAPTYFRAGYFLGLNGHIRAHVKSHPDWSKEDYVQLAHRFVEMEIEAHPDLAGLPISEVQIDEVGDVHWLDKGACDSEEVNGTIRAKIGK